MAATTGYFSFFSLFPLLLGVIAGGSFFLDSEEIRSHLDKILTDTLPGSYLDNVAHLEAVYGSVSPIIVLLLWLYFSARVLFWALRSSR
jgi:uncharacterized BrkB/YihY/UPF0761 family membrane protein